MAVFVVASYTLTTYGVLQGYSEKVLNAVNIAKGQGERQTLQVLLDYFNQKIIYHYDIYIDCQLLRDTQTATQT
jgi:hypothetical protein